MKKIIILDFSIAETFIFSYDESPGSDITDYFDKINDEAGYNFKETNCQWMIVDELKLTIQ
tara:strand:- start:786 stop:968 length:183 start_codon:yes stop_codon:yes gene_type:complete